MPVYPNVRDLSEETLLSALLLADELLLNHNGVTRELQKRRKVLSAEVDRRDMSVGQRVIQAVWGIPSADR